MSDLPRPAASWRFAVSSAENFDHLKNPNHFSIKRDPNILRDIVELKSVCWIYFSKQLGKHKAGKYLVQLRVNVSSQTQWQSGAPCHISVNKIDRSQNGEVWLRPNLVTEAFAPEYWKSIANGTFQVNKSSQISHNSVVVYNKGFQIVRRLL